MPLMLNRHQGDAVLAYLNLDELLTALLQNYRTPGLTHGQRAELQRVLLSQDSTTLHAITIRIHELTPAKVRVALTAPPYLHILRGELTTAMNGYCQYRCCDCGHTRLVQCADGGLLNDCPLCDSFNWELITDVTPPRPKASTG